MSVKNLFKRRKQRIRFKLLRHNNGKPRLTVHRTNCHIYAQIIDDTTAKTLVSASTLDKSLSPELKSGGNKLAAEQVGKLIAEKALKAGVVSVVFDRSGYLYHGRIKALADSARDNGLSF